MLFLWYHLEIITLPKGASAIRQKKYGFKEN